MSKPRDFGFVPHENHPSDSPKRQPKPSEVDLYYETLRLEVRRLKALGHTQAHIEAALSVSLDTIIRLVREEFSQGEKQAFFIDDLAVL